jgi:hypothetical protein
MLIDRSALEAESKTRPGLVEVDIFDHPLCFFRHILGRSYLIRDFFLFEN